jgi:hypothetical protein
MEAGGNSKFKAFLEAHGINEKSHPTLQVKFLCCRCNAFDVMHKIKQILTTFSRKFIHRSLKCSKYFCSFSAGVQTFNEKMFSFQAKYSTKACEFYRSLISYLADPDKVPRPVDLQPGEGVKAAYKSNTTGSGNAFGLAELLGSIH